MKRTKKIVSILLTLVMALAMSIPAFAEGTTPDPMMQGEMTGGSITISNAKKDQTYNVYQILYLVSYDKDKNAYIYEANSYWKNWLKTDTEAQKYVQFISGNGETEYVTWKMKDEEDTDKDIGMETFAKLAQAYAVSSSNSITSVDTKKATSDGEVKFTGLKLGYYLVDTTLGTLCSLNTTKPNADIEEKNTKPTIDKKVGEDSKENTDEYWGKKNTAQIGDTVEFKTTVHAKKGAQGYVVHDQMSEGLTLIKDIEADTDAGIDAKNNITVTVNNVALTKGKDYNITYDVKCTNKDKEEAVCAFHITFTQTYLDTITADTNIVITYSAILNDKAVISTDSNDNKTMLNYGDGANGVGSYETEWDETKTYTFKFDIVKTDSTYKLLTGAKFELYDAQTAGNKIDLVKESDGVYRVATTVEKNAEGFTSAVIEAGKATVKGLDSDTYWLDETEAPAGYNKLSGRVAVKIENANLTTTMTGDTWAEGNGGVQITNSTGTELPSTGGIGTTVFYAAGVILALGAAVVLVARRRMKTE